jgi:hypothetical protein
MERGEGRTQVPALLAYAIGAFGKHRTPQSALAHAISSIDSKLIFSRLHARRATV